MSIGDSEGSCPGGDVWEMPKRRYLREMSRGSCEGESCPRTKVCIIHSHLGDGSAITLTG